MDQNNYEQLLRIGVNGLTVVLGLVVGRVSQGIVDVTTPPSITQQSLLYATVATCTLITILFSMVGIVVTINYAHGELKIPFRPIYLITNLLWVSLPFYLAVTAISSAMSSIAKTEDFNLGLFKESLGGLMIGFGSLLAYLLFIYRFDDPKVGKEGTLPNRYYIWVGGFQFLGISFAVLLYLFALHESNVGLLSISLLGVFGSGIYLILTPILRVRFGDITPTPPPQVKNPSTSI
ncbi:MAG: hypothetical protein GC204_02795 [Chloroflexi bacterium]|nr:hypothetical protein [Chloroflexota bacterium]